MSQQSDENDDNKNANPKNGELNAYRSINEDDGARPERDTDSDLDSDETGNDHASSPQTPMSSSRRQADSMEESDNSNSPSLLNILSSVDEVQEMEGIALLRQIFPDESTEALRKLHYEHIRKFQQQHTSNYPLQTAQSAPTTQLNVPGRSIGPTSKLGRRLVQQFLKQHPSVDPAALMASWQEQQEANLPSEDFLRLPIEEGVRRLCKDGSWRYQLVQELEDRALRQCGLYNDGSWYSAVIIRDAKLGLGMTLYEEKGVLHVHSLSTTTIISSNGEERQPVGPSYKAGIRPGDVILGINGFAFQYAIRHPTPSLSSTSVDTKNMSLLQYAVKAIHQSPDPIVIHLQRHQIPIQSLINKRRALQQDDFSIPSSPERTLSPSATIERATSLLDTTTTDDTSLSSSVTSMASNKTKTAIHPFATVLATRGLLSSKNGEFFLSSQVDWNSAASTTYRILHP